MKKARLISGLVAVILSAACLLAVLSGCGPSPKPEDSDIEVRIGRIDDRDKKKTDDSLDPGEKADAENDPVVKGKWVLKNKRTEQIGDSYVDTENETSRTISVDLYKHSFSFSYTPSERVDELDVPYTENYYCVCSKMPDEIEPGKSFFIDIEARTASGSATVHGMCCRIYVDKSPSLDIGIDSAVNYDYTDLIIYPVYAGTSPGPGYGIEADAPPHDGEDDSVLLTMPTVTESVEKAASSFTIQFATNYGNSYFEYEWVRD